MRSQTPAVCEQRHHRTGRRIPCKDSPRRLSILESDPSGDAATILTVDTARCGHRVSHFLKHCERSPEDHAVAALHLDAPISEPVEHHLGGRDSSVLGKRRCTRQPEMGRHMTFSTATEWVRSCRSRTHPAATIALRIIVPLSQSYRPRRLPNPPRHSTDSLPPRSDLGGQDLPRWSLEVHPAVTTSMFCAGCAALVLFYVVAWGGRSSFERLEKPATAVSSPHEAVRLGHFPVWASRPPGRYTTPRTTQTPRHRIRVWCPEDL
jgi:hypothetical protein